MWIITKDGSAINLSRVTSIFVAQTASGFEVKVNDVAYDSAIFKKMYGLHDSPYAKKTFTDRFTTLQTFDTKDNAAAYIEMLVDCLNGKKPVEYAFTWLKILKAPKPAEPAKTKTYDADLVDGVPF